MTKATATIAILLGLTLGAAYLVAKKRKNAQRGAMMALLALLCAFAQGAWAQNYNVWDGSSSTQSPVHWTTGNWNTGEVYDEWDEINNAAQLAYLIEHWGEYYNKKLHLKADLDMTAASWTPLGHDSNAFAGTFYGENHTIRIYISNTNDDNQGLFAEIDTSGKVQDLHLTGMFNVGNARKVGGIAGDNYGTIENCWVSADMASNHYNPLLDADLGGIAGLNESGATIQFCCMTGNVQNTGRGNSGVGGIAGSNDGTIEHCTFYGSVSVNHDQSSKYVGDQDGTVNDLRDTYDDTHYSSASGYGMYAHAYKFPYSVTVNTIGHGSIQTEAVGEYDVPGTRAGETFTLHVTSGSVARVTITNADSNDVPLQGQANDGSSYWFVMEHKNITATFVFYEDWPTQGTGTEEDPYLISSADDWNKFAHNVTYGRSYSDYYVKLTDDISVTTMAGGYQADDNYQPFSGTFDGDGHTLTLNVNNQSRFAAPFKCVSGATIKNLRTAGTIDGTGNADGKLLAGIIGVSFGNTTITGCRSSVTLTTGFGFDAALAGLVAGTKGGSLTIEGCVFDGSMTGSSNTRCAGIAGYEYGGTTTTIRNTIFAPATLTVSTTADGETKTITRDPDATITNCYYTQTLGTAQGTEAVANTFFLNELGSLVQDYGLVRVFQHGMFSGGKAYIIPGSISCAGTELDPYIISNDENWNRFTSFVNGGTTYSGKYVKLMADINVSDMAGSSEGNSFQGTFLGNGHTLTFTKGSSESAFDEEYCAPFRHVNNATIQDLKVAGAIYTSRKFTAGLVAHSYGTTNITDCQVGTFIHSILNGDGTHGGIVSMPSGTLNIEGCAYTGRLLTNNGTDRCSGFVAWHNEADISFNNSIYAPSGDIPSGWSAINNGATFLRGSEYYIITNCYYTETLGEAQGIRAYATVPDNEIGLKITIGETTVYPMFCTIRGIDTLYGLLPVSITPTTTGSNFTLGTGYTATLNGEEVTETPIIIDTFGDYTLVITGTGNYEGSKTFQIPVARLFEGEGTEQSPCLIGSTSEWESFCTLVANGNSFSGKYVKMIADIDISTTVGLSGDKPFSGTFLGDGYTLTTNISSTTTGTGVNEQGVAPFHYINGATIKDLTVAGTIASASYHTSGLVGFADGTNLIENCIVTATLNISNNYAGGLVGHGRESSITIRGCVFAGTINGVDGDRNNIGGIWGWSDSGTPTLEDCMEAGTYTHIASMHPMGLQNAAGAITNCYYVTPQIGEPSNACTVSGAKQAYAFTTAHDDLGELVKDYGTIKVYQNGILYNGIYYVALPGSISLTVDGYGESTENNHWAFIASPVAGSIGATTVGNIFSATEYDLYRLNPSSLMWENYKVHDGNAAPGFNLVNGRGYLYATKETKTLGFSGTFNEDDEMTIANLSHGFNLVGNPFTTDAYIDKPYYTLNGDGSAIVAQPNGTTTPIAPCHGVIVEVNGNESVTFSKTAPAATANQGMLNITVSEQKADTRGPATAIDNAIVRFGEGEQLGKFHFGNPSANISIPQGGKEYAVANVGRDGVHTVSTNEMPVNFKASKDGEYTISFNPENVEFDYLHLIDNLTGNDVDLLTQPSYTFTANTSDYASRFRLVFVSNDAQLGGEGSDDFAFISNGQIILTGVTGNSVLQVIDLTGRVLASYKGANRIGTSGLVAGVYVLRIINGDDVKTQKIVIK